jgi:hypothetical protein
VTTYYQNEWRTRPFDILVDGQKVGEQTVERGAVPRLFDVEYAIPAALVKDKKTVTVRFEATGDNEIPGVDGVHVIRADAQR